MAQLTINIIVGLFFPLSVCWGLVFLSDLVFNRDAK